jgi:hypothetical protein
MGGAADWPLVCEGCHFDAGIDLVDSSVRTVRITGSELPGFDGTRLRLDGILDLAGSRVAGCVRLERAKVSGQLSMQGSVAGDGSAAGGDAVAATGLSVDGDVDCAWNSAPATSWCTRPATPRSSWPSGTMTGW